MTEFKDCFAKFWPEARVLDVGCGGGNITAEISHLVPSGYVLGVDNWFQSVIHAIQCFPRDK